MSDADPHSAELTMVRRHRRRWIRRTLISLLAGFTLSVCVAWGVAALPHLGNPTALSVIHEQRDGIHVVGDTSVRPGHTEVWVYFTEGRAAERVAHAIRSGIEGRAHRQGVGFRGIQRSPYWSSARLPARSQLSTQDVQSSRYDTASGWPLRALMRTDVFLPDPDEVSAGTPVSEIPSLWTLKIHRHVWLPYRPIWPGLLLNTLFYAAIWFAFFTGLAAVRTGRRLRRGLCPVCRYDLRGLPERACPECGWGKDPSAQQAAES